MPRKKSVQIALGPVDQILLGQQQKKGLRRHWLRADVILRAARGQTNYMIAKELEISRNTVKKWRFRFAREGIAGLKSRPIPGRPKRIAGVLRLNQTSLTDALNR